MPVRSTPQGWTLETNTTAYVIGLNSTGDLVQRYWGPWLPYPEDYPPPPEATGWASFNGRGQLLPEEYAPWGGLRYTEPCLKVTFADGVRDVVLRFESAETEDEVLALHFEDAHYPLRLTLVYRVHPVYDLIERQAIITNTGDVPFTVERAFSACWHLPADGAYRLSHLTGRWFDEWHLHRDPLAQGVTVLESRRGLTGHHHNPWFAADDGTATEDGGDVWFGVLAWSGSWKLTAEKTDFGRTAISLGVNDWDFAWRVPPGDIFSTPVCYAGYTPEGFGAASRLLHDFIRGQILPHGSATHKILYNSWEATLFEVSAAGQTALAEQAARLGVELFVMDDGWFKGRTSDRAGLGDWTPDPVKFPGGLKPLIDRVNALGMDFGLWVEPEMVNPDSDLYRAHPDWVLHFPHRERTTARQQLMLNLARPEVQQHLIETLSALLREHNITFIKWDANRNMSEPGWLPEDDHDAREVWVRYTLGLYQVWGTLRERFPHVIWQSCSGGGGRVDTGILRYADQVWASDNTEATARLGIQAGFSQVFPASIMEAWVTDMGRGVVPLRFRLHVSMTGVLGIGGNLAAWTAAELAEAAHWIGVYKTLRHIIQQG
ncbi:MAG: alpha-galactosidase, partial [Anaerolineae bacterium]|nr:alpha-galactosidase [Anaerolineae bacterium]